MKKIIMFSLISLLAVSCKKNETSDKEQTTNTNSTLNNNESEHISYVRNHFTSTGNDVYGISVVGKNGANGYVIMANGYNTKMGVGFNSTVKTDGTDGIKIVDGAADYKQY